MKIKLEIDVPEFEWVDTPTAYWTPIGEVGEKFHVQLIKDLIEYIQRLPERQWIIESNHQHVRMPLCKSWVEDRLSVFVDKQNSYWWAEKLSHFLMGFQERTGIEFDNYTFKHKVLSNGKKIQFKTFSMMFNTEDEALRHIAKIYTSRDGFEFMKEEKEEG